jgi:hypothetical protein
MNLASADRRKLAPLLDELARGVEDLLLSGLTTASAPTRQALDVAFQEASRMKLLRLGSTLRVASEELGRFTRNDLTFSRRRLCFFLGRAWVLCQGLGKALREGDEASFDRLLRSPAGEAVGAVEVVALGVAKKVTPAFCAFEFRLRRLDDGQRLVWSCVFPVRPGMDVPPDAFLHLPQKQQFNPSLFLEGKALRLTDVTVTREGEVGRIALGEQSKVTAGAPFTDWQRFRGWDVAAALERLRNRPVTPFDLDIELQEEVVLEHWEVGEPAVRDESQVAYPILSGAAAFDAMVSRSAEGAALRPALDKLRKQKERPPLFGLLHYERCRLVLQPLALFAGGPPQQLMVSNDKVDRAALLRALKF